MSGRHPHVRHPHFPPLRDVIFANRTVSTIHTLFLSIQDFKDFVLLFGNFAGQDEML